MEKKNDSNTFLIIDLVWMLAQIVMLILHRFFIPAMPTVVVWLPSIILLAFSVFIWVFALLAICVAYALMKINK